MTTDIVNFRTGPSLEADVMKTLSAGVNVEVLDHDPAGWSKVRTNGAVGYIRSDFLSVPLSVKSMPFKTTDIVNFRWAPSLDADIISTLADKTEVEVLEHDPAGWSQVKYSNSVGYIRSDLISIYNTDAGGSASVTSSNTSGSTSSVMWTNGNVNFRASPTTDSEVIKVLGINSSIQVLDHNSNGWSKVAHEGLTGYIRSDLLSENIVSTSGSTNGSTNGNVELLEWSVVKNMITYGALIPVIDVRTGMTYNIKCFSIGGHADVEPATKSDTDTHSQTHNGVKSWSARPVWVTIGGRTIAASLHGMPHDVSTIPDNGMNGHICLHFLGSTAGNSAESYKRDLQNAVQEAWNSR